MRWLIRFDGKTLEASESEIKSMINSGSLSRGALVWREGLTTWQPIDVHFSMYQSPDYAPSEKKHSSQNYKFFAFLIFFWASIGLVVALYGLWDVTNIVRLSGAIASFVAGGTLLVKIWNHPFRQTHHGLGGGLLALCLLAISAEALFIASNIYRIGTLIRLDSAAQQFSDYSVTADGLSRTVRLQGLIGQGVLVRIKELENKFGPFRILEIDSHGGLVDEALKLANYVENKKLKVVSRTNCDSACILVAIASPLSYAEETLDFGFHGVSSTVETDDELIKYATDIGGERSRSFMLSHHIPEVIVNEAAHIDRDHVMSIPALSLFNSGSLAGLVDGNRIVRGVGAGTTIE
jgi:hypothetical protein